MPAILTNNWRTNPSKPSTDFEEEEKERVEVVESRMSIFDNGLKKVIKGFFCMLVIFLSG